MQNLVKKAQQGDAESFVALMEECKSGMYRIAKGFFSDEADVADAVSEAVLSAYEHIGTLRKAAYFRTWLMRILINTCNQMLRESRRMELVEAIPEQPCQSSDFSEVEFREMLSSFPEDCRIILLLYYGEQFTVREIAQILGMNENTVKSKLWRVRGELRETYLYSM